MDLSLEKHPAGGWVAVAKTTGHNFGPWQTERTARAGVTLLDEWAERNLAELGGEQLGELRERAHKAEAPTEHDRWVAMMVDEYWAVAGADGDQAPPLIEADLLVSKQRTAMMFTFGPLYIPFAEDTDGETTDPDTLQKALHSWMEWGGRQVNLQHSPVRAGKLLELCCWPYPVECQLTVPNEADRAVSLPAGVPFIGVRWDPWCWEKVVTGEITGLSLHGWARKVLLPKPESV